MRKISKSLVFYRIYRLIFWVLLIITLVSAVEIVYNLTPVFREAVWIGKDSAGKTDEYLWQQVIRLSLEGVGILGVWAKLPFWGWTLYWLVGKVAFSKDGE